MVTVCNTAMTSATLITFCQHYEHPIFHVHEKRQNINKTETINRKREQHTHFLKPKMYG